MRNLNVNCEVEVHNLLQEQAIEKLNGRGEFSKTLRLVYTSTGSLAVLQVCENFADNPKSLKAICAKMKIFA